VRYYRIEIGGEYAATYTSQVLDQNDPNALNVEIDVVVANYAQLGGNSMVRIWGVSLPTIGQAKNFNGAPIAVYAGMSKGLPLADPTQQGLIIYGKIQQAFGNWLGTSMTLDLIINPDGDINVPIQAQNIAFNWPKGTPLNQAITNALSSSYSGYDLQINIDPTLSLPENTYATFSNLPTFASWLKTTTQSIKGGNYSGVDIAIMQKTLKIYDGSSISNPILLKLTDFIGQPTWIGPGQIQFNTVMRADLSVYSVIQFPSQNGVSLLQPNITASSLSFSRLTSAFDGTFIVNFVRHVGNFRQPDAQSWISTFNCYSSLAVKA
jgi:hypothetical protein